MAAEGRVVGTTGKTGLPTEKFDFFPVIKIKP